MKERTAIFNVEVKVSWCEYDLVSKNKEVIKQIKQQIREKFEYQFFNLQIEKDTDGYFFSDATKQAKTKIILKEVF